MKIEPILSLITSIIKMTIVVQLTHEMAIWAKDALGNAPRSQYQNLEDSEQVEVELPGLREYSLLLKSLSYGYNVIGGNEFNTESGIDLTKCVRKYSERPVLVDETTYERLTFATPDGELVPITLLDKGASFNEGEIFDVVSLSKTPIRINWVGSHPEVICTVKFARVL